jgi:hypothetical protein
MTKFRFLDFLHDTAIPQVQGRAPFWRPTPAGPWRDIREPAWSWSLPLMVETHSEERHINGSTSTHTVWAHQGRLRLFADDMVHVLDANAAYLSAASSVEVAHGALTRTQGRMFDRTVPGYWLLDTPEWRHDEPFSPLGTGSMPSKVWLTTPTVTVLAGLADQGLLSPITVTDSWTAARGVRLREWTKQIAETRANAIAAENHSARDDIKTSYSQAVTLMGVAGKSTIFRPDWAQFIRCQHSANMFRHAWGAYTMGHGPLAAGGVDELIVTGRALNACSAMGAEGHRPPIRIDPAGVAMGTFKIKRSHTAQGWMSR